MAVGLRVSGSSACPVKKVDRPGAWGRSKISCKFGWRMSPSTKRISPAPSWASVIARLVASDVLPSSDCSEVTRTVLGGCSGAE